MSVNASATSESATALALRYVDVVLVIAAAAPAIVLGVPVLGYAIAAGAWIAQRLLAILDKRWTGRLSDPVRRSGARLFESFGRIWLLAGAIIAAGVIGGRADGLAAAVTIFVAYSVAFVIRIASGPPERSAP